MIGPESIVIALQGMLANRLRSALTITGMLIGVASVILLVSVGNGSSAAVQARIESLGTNVVLVMRQFTPGGAFGGRSSGVSSMPLTLQDAAALQDPSTAPDIKSVSPSVSASVTAVAGGVSYSPSSFIGTTPSYEEARDYSMAAGTFFTNGDESSHNRVAVLGQTVVSNLFGSADPIGQTVTFNGVQFSIIGVLNSKGSNGLMDQDDVVIAPLTAVQDTLTGYGPVSSLTVEAKSAGQVNAAAAETQSILLAQHHISNAAEADFRVLNQSSLLQTTASTSQVFTTLLGAVAAISLLVAGIGVMNIMLVTVTERTREIGIRKAIGARRSDILAQFLVESALLSTVGGVGGVIAGIVLSQFSIAGVQPVIPIYSVVLAFSVAVIVGLFFGIYPATRAAALRPIEALRYE
jgi:putative ABC transport system permease protein